MEKLKIRSLLKNFKFHKVIDSSPKDIETTSQNLPRQYQTIASRDNQNKISCFTIDTTQIDHREDHNHQSDSKKHLASLEKEDSKKRRKISNRSYMNTVIIRRKPQFTNLSELGIRTKQISDRTLLANQNNDRIRLNEDKQFHEPRYIDRNPNAAKINFVNLYKKEKEKIQRLQYKDIRKRSISNDPKHFKNGYQLNSQINETKSSFTSASYKVKQKTYPIIKNQSPKKMSQSPRRFYVYRKNSDISPWDYQKPF